jgi:hypothetical protein
MTQELHIDRCIRKACLDDLDTVIALALRFDLIGLSSEIPTEVSIALTGQRPGRYTLSDGTRWSIDFDGGIHRIP